MVINLESLVLRGVSVLGDGQTVGLRLGSYETMEQPTAIPFSMRHPPLGCRGFKPSTASDWPAITADKPAANADKPGAGRPRSLAGVLVRRSPAAFAGRTAILGGSKPMAATRLCRL